MHELSIAMSIVEIAEEEAKKAGAVSISAIDLEIGTLSGIVMEALDFAWEAAVKESMLERAEKRVHRVEAKAKCLDCNHEFPAKTLFETCPSCGSYFTTLLQGKEMKIKSITLET